MDVKDLYESIMSKPKKEKSKGRAAGGFGPEQGMARAGLKALKVPSFKHGGKVKKTDVYKLHKGEKVLTAKQSKSHPGLDC